MYEKEQNRLTEKLSKIQQSGIGLYMDGKPASPESIARRCVREEMTYMADYVLADDGTLKELHYDKVADWK